MARIRNIGELTWSKWHSLPSAVGSECVLTLTIDPNLRRGVGIYYEPHLGELARVEDPDGNRWGVIGMTMWGEIQDFSTQTQTVERLQFENGEARFEGRDDYTLKQPDDFIELANRACEELVEENLATLYSDCFFLQAGMIAELPLQLFRAFFLFSEKQPVALNWIDLDWDYSESEANTLFLSFSPTREVTNTDNFLKAVARKLDKCLRLTRQP